MTTLYNYKWPQSIALIIGFCTLQLFWIISDTTLSTGNYLFFSLCFCIGLLSELYSMCRVTLSEDKIHLDFLFRQRRTYSFHEIKAYKETPLGIAGSNIELCLTPHTGKQVRLKSTGTKNLDDLSSKLSKLFPTLPLKS